MKEPRKRLFLFFVILSVYLRNRIRTAAMKIKEEFHHLIDTIEDEEVLKGYFDIIQTLNDNQNGEGFGDLTDEQRVELLLSYEESLDEKNLIQHEEVKKEYSKWLKK